MTRWGEGRVGVSQCGGGHVIDRLCVGPGDLQANGQLSPLTRRKSHLESDFRTEQRQIRLLCEIPDDELAGGWDRQSLPRRCRLRHMGARVDDRG